jgi:alkylation response protein AidB-like acyl-CoA dehydrogenase
MAQMNDFKSVYTYEGTQDIRRLIIAWHIIRISAFA